MWVATAASLANNMPLTRIGRTFVLALSRASLKSLSSDRVRRKIPSVVASKAWFSSRAKQIQKSVGASTQDCLTPLRISIRSRGGAVEQHRFLHISVED